MPMQLDPHAMALVAVVLSILAVVVLVLWILLPFAVFGIRRRAEQIVRLQQEQRVLLEDVSRYLAHLASEVDRQLTSPEVTRGR
ncbi:MAG: hypothetical protein H6983_13320 [Ectothiorhodospiraceae bacterium]|nr:hypothetical protein [Ectothiorhodospiraceae bacterium]